MKQAEGGWRPWYGLHRHAGRFGRGRNRRCRLAFNREAERRAVSFAFGFAPGPPAMELDDSLDGGQADARSVDLLVELLEQVEYLRFVSTIAVRLLCGGESVFPVMRGPNEPKAALTQVAHPHNYTAHFRANTGESALGFVQVLLEPSRHGRQVGGQLARCCATGPGIVERLEPELPGRRILL